MKTALLAIAIAAGLLGQQKPAAGSLRESGQKLKFTLERQEQGKWRIVDPATVLDQGDRVRFRVTSTFKGYLYVLALTTSGNYELLFPRGDTGTGNEIAANREYVVPQTAGWFKVTGPTGYDTLFWVISPTDLSREPSYKPLPPPPAHPVAPSSMKPRCDDTVFKARGDCVDPEAGPQTVGKSVPSNLSSIAAKPREILFFKSQGAVTVSSPEPLSGPAIYEVRLAHR